MDLAQGMRAAMRRGRTTGSYMGTVTAVDATNFALTVDIGTGTALTGVRWVGVYTPAVGDFVVLLRIGAAWVTLGKLSKTLTGPGYTTGVATIRPVTTVYGLRDRATGVWEWDTPGHERQYMQQGSSTSYSARAGYLWWPSIADAIPSGATITSARVQMVRSSVADQPDLATPRLYQHTLASPPASGAPGGLTGAVWSPGSVARGQASSWQLPSAWLAALLAGSIRGVATYSFAASDLSHFRSNSEGSSVNGLLTIDYMTPA